MGKELAEVGLVVVAGFLIGGVYSTWKNGAKVASTVLALLAALALAGAIAWFLS